MPQTCTLATPNIIISSFSLLSVLLLLFPHAEICYKRRPGGHKRRKNSPVHSLSCFWGRCLRHAFYFSQALFQIANFTRCSGTSIFFWGGRINTNCRHSCTPNGGIATKQAYVNVSGGVTCHVTVQQVSVKLHVSVEQEVAVFCLSFLSASCCVFYAATFTRAVVLCTHL